MKEIVSSLIYRLKMNTKDKKDYFSYIPSALIYEFCLVTFLTFLVVVSTSNDVLLKTLVYLKHALTFWSFTFPIGIGFLILVIKDRIIFKRTTKDKIKEIGADLFESLIGTFRLITVTLLAFVIAYVFNHKSLDAEGWVVTFFAIITYIENSCFIAFKRYKTWPRP